MLQTLHTFLLDDFPFFLGTAIFSSLQGCPVGFRSGICLGNSRTFRSVLKPLLCILCDMLSIVVLLNCKPARNPFHFREGFLPGFSSRMPPPCLTIEMVLIKWCAVSKLFGIKKHHLCQKNRGVSFSWIESLFWTFWLPAELCLAWLVKCCSDDCPSGCLLWPNFSVPSGHFDWVPSFGKTNGCCKYLPFENDGGYCALGHFQCCGKFLIGPALCLVTKVYR